MLRRRSFVTLATVATLAVSSFSLIPPTYAAEADENHCAATVEFEDGTIAAPAGCHGIFDRYEFNAQALAGLYGSHLKFSATGVSSAADQDKEKPVRLQYKLDVNGVEGTWTDAAIPSLDEGADNSTRFTLNEERETAQTGDFALSYRATNQDGLTEVTEPIQQQVNATPGLASGVVDVPSTGQFADEINWLVDKGISTGWLRDGGAKDYRPLESMHRDAMAAFMYRLAGSPEFTAPVLSPFKDVPTGSQFYKEITWMVSKGITTGYPDQTFHPLEDVHRDAMAAFMYRFEGSPQFTAPAQSPFHDVSTGWQFYGEMAWLAEKGISQGWPDGSYRPLESIHRDAMAAFMYRLENPPQR